jgi:hypothetical protein
MGLQLPKRGRAAGKVVVDPGSPLGAGVVAPAKRLFNPSSQMAGGQTAGLLASRPDWDITTPELKAAWQDGRKELFYPYAKTYAQTLGEQD